MKELVWLIGFSGSGKSTVGPALARRLRVPFVDTDVLIENQTGHSIDRVFKAMGERVFRKMETEAIYTIVDNSKAAVVALGGGAFNAAVNRMAVASSGTSIYLSCSQRELFARLRSKLDRPLLQTEGKSEAEDMRELREKIKRMLTDRLDFYRQADMTVSTTNRTVSETVETIRKKLRK